jgi:hypothetical protein
MSSILALSPVFSVDRNCTEFCVTAQAQRNLETVCHRLLTREGGALVGLYITENPEAAYNSNSPEFGRVAAVVRPLPMPAGQTVQGFPSGCLEYRGGTLVDRWPVGWPCEVVFYSPRGGPVLRDAVYAALGVSDYASFAMQFLQGPIYLGPMPALRDHLIAEVRHQVSRDPAAQVRPF